MPSLADLIRMGKQYIGDAMPGGSLNPETAPVARQANYLSGILDPASQVSQDATNWHKRTQIGLKDQLAGRQTPEAEQAYQTMMMAAGMAPIGMTAWHGSPHKFDKFSLDKIGTGEGAQAYGHGLYLAESPGVAKSYADNLSPPADVLFNGKPAYQLDWLKDNTPEELALRAVGTEKGFDEGRKVVEKLSRRDPDYAAALQWMDSNKNKIGLQTKSQLYKTDIPDEAVARFLDWDKKLSEQSPEIQKAWDKFVNSKAGRSADKSLNGMLSRKEGPFADPTGKDLYSTLSEGLIGFGKARPFAQVKEEATARLAKQGIPGIRYLDGGSRSAGQGSSNFVAFDPEMIRILERNGQPTGLEPWKPGEYRLKDLIGKE